MLSIRIVIVIANCIIPIAVEREVIRVVHIIREAVHVAHIVIVNFLNLIVNESICDIRIRHLVCLILVMDILELVFVAAVVK